jgi:hypothetical protein
MMAVLALVGRDDRPPERPAAVASPTSTSHQAPEVDAPVTTVDSPPGAGPSHVSARTEQGARAAAVRFLELTENVVELTPAEGAAVQRSIATDRAADGLAAELLDQLTAIATQVPDGVVVEVAPIGVRSVDRGDGWDVSVWYVEVIVYGQELAVEQWRTATYSLMWEHDEWRMDALDSTVGPAPTRPASVLAATTVEIAAAVADFEGAGLVP